MFRVTRLILPKRNSLSVPLLNKRALPKQLVVEFSIIPDKMETSQQKKKSETTEGITASKSSALPSEFVGYGVLRDLLYLRRKNAASGELVHSSMELGPEEVVKVLKGVAESRNRSLDFLESVCYLFKTNKWSLSLREISDVLYSFAKLSYRDEATIKVITKPIFSIGSIRKTNIISSILHSLGVLKYRDTALLDALLKSILNQTLDIKTSVECLMSLSFLNYPCKEAESLAKFLSEVNETDYYQTNDYINFIWSCVILNQLEYVSSNHLKKVLSKEFVSKLLIPNYHLGIKVKFLNIVAAAEQVSIGHSELFPKISLSRGEKNSSFFNSVVDTLTYILPEPGYIKTLVDTGAGFFLDVHYCVNSQNSPVPLSRSKGATKVGILLLNYNETCSDNTPTGIFAFKLRILQQQGYRVVVLHHAYYPINAPLSEKIDAIRQKICEAADSQDSAESTSS